MAERVLAEGRFGVDVIDNVISAKTEMTSDDVVDLLLVADVIVVAAAVDVDGRPVLEVLFADTSRRLYFAQQSRSAGRYRNTMDRALEVREAIANGGRPKPLDLDDHETVDQQETDKGVLTGEENVRVAEAVVLEDQQKAEYEIRKVLHRNRDEDSVEVWRAAGIKMPRRRCLTLKDSGVKVTFADATGNEAAFVSASFRRGDDDGELKQTPRPNRQNNDTQRAVIANLTKGNRLTLYNNSQFQQEFYSIIYIVF